MQGIWKNDKHTIEFTTGSHAIVDGKFTYFAFYTHGFGDTNYLHLGRGGKLIWERPGIKAPTDPEFLAKLAIEGWKWFTYENEDGTPVEDGKGYFYT